MLTFERANWNDLDSTSLQGYVKTTYDRLVATFGEPTGACDKTTAEWNIKFSDGTVASIYDYKETKTPKGLYNWHIGGMSSQACRNVANVLGLVSVNAGFN